MIIDEEEYTILKELIDEVNAGIDFSIELITSYTTVESPTKLAYLSGRIATLKGILSFIKEKEDDLRKKKDAE